MHELPVSTVVKTGNLFACSYCGSPLLAGEAPTVTCDACNKVNATQGALPWALEQEREKISVDLRHAQDERPREVRRDGPIAQPRTVAIERQGGAVTLRCPGTRRRDSARLVGAAVALGLLAWWKWGAPEGPTALAAFGAGIVALSALPALLRALGPTVLTASRDGLEVRGMLGLHRRRIAREQLTQLFCERYTIRFDEFPDETGFRLKVALSDQKLLTLAEFSDPTSALYLERELERALGIVDQPVGV